MHIFLGITGPVLVCFHTVLKLSGIVALSFWSMVLVVLSGIIGKYIYELIPHSLSGMELNRIELEAEISDEVMPGVVSIPHGWGHDRPGIRLSIALLSSVLFAGLQWCTA